MMGRTREVLKALRCCRDDLCTRCPLQREICDEFPVEEENVPSALLDMIETELNEMVKHAQKGNVKQALEVLRENGWKEVK